MKVEDKNRDIYMAEKIRVVAAYHPFKIDRIETFVDSGHNLQSILEIVQPNPILRRHARIMVMDQPIAKSMWNCVTPHPGVTVYIRVLPSGGGGGGKSPLRIILTLVVIVAAYYFAPILGPILAGGGASAGTVAFATAVAGGVITAVGTALINVLLPPTPLELPTLSGSSEFSSPTLSVKGARNSARPYGVVPKVYGTHRIWPPLGAEQVTEIAGPDQYLRVLVVWGIGPLAINELKIGETLLSTFEDVEVETVTGEVGDPPITLFPDTISTFNVGVILNQVDSPTERTTDPNVDEISVDVAFLSGLVEFSGGAQKQNKTVSISVEYRVNNPVGSWVLASTITTTARQSAVVRNTLRFHVARDTYDVRLQRTTADTSNTQIFDKATWTVIRSIVDEDPIQESGLAKTAIRIRANDQLNGFIDQLNGVVTAKINDYNGSSWVKSNTRNPASAFRDVLQGSSNKLAVLDTRIDEADLEEWHDYCATNEFWFDFVIDFQTNVWEMLVRIARAGRSSPTLKDGKISIVTDKAKTTIIQHFSPRNTFGFSGKRSFDTLPDGWRIRFVNRDQGYKNDERIVPFDGFTEGTVNILEALDFAGVTDSDIIYKIGKYYEATAKLRREIYTFNTDIENVVCTVGDLIRVSHDVPLFGVGSARVKSISLDGGSNMTGVTIDSALLMMSGNVYSMRFRKSDGGSVLVGIALDSGEQKVLVFDPAISVGQPMPAVGDLGLFGVTGSESVEMIIHAIEPTENMGAKITAVDAAPDVHLADQQTIPTFNSQITPPPILDQPIVESARSDAAVVFTNPDGTPEVRILIDLAFNGLIGAERIDALEVKYRETGSQGPWNWLGRLRPEAEQVSILGVDEGETYDIYLRYVFNDGSISPFTIISAHQVEGIINSPRTESLLGWPGVLVGCNVGADGSLIANGAQTIADLPSTIALLASTIDTIVTSVSPISYTTPTIDLGSDVTVTPRMTITSNGVVTQTMQTGTLADGAPIGSFVPLGVVTARYFKLRISVTDTVPSVQEMLSNIDPLSEEENYNDLDTATESGAFFELIAAGHFKIETKGELSSIRVARIDAFVGSGAGFTFEVVSKNTTLTSRSVLATEIKIYNASDVLSNAVIDISLIGARV